MVWISEEDGLQTWTLHHDNFYLKFWELLIHLRTFPSNWIYPINLPIEVCDIRCGEHLRLAEELFQHDLRVKGLGLRVSVILFDIVDASTVERIRHVVREP